MNAAEQSNRRTTRLHTESNPLYRMLPSVHELLQSSSLAETVARAEHDRLVKSARRVLERLRDEITQGLHSESTLKLAINELPDEIGDENRRGIPHSLRPMINATGVILHTNLGRAPLSRKAIENISAVAAGYSNLEFDLTRGERGLRDVHVESHLLALLGEAAGMDLKPTHRAIVVNNCAAATFLALHALARGKEILVSRGELVEIGGGFRIPEILEASGAILREVGTTNRTRISDYEQAVTSETGLILRVHQSNFSMEGFVERPGLEELVALGRRAGISVMEDQGTGLVEPLDLYGIRGEATLAASLAAGCDASAASGDKLLGGPQCGILVGKHELMNRIRRDPLYRTFRVDKLTYAALEATLIQFLSGDQMNIPILRMLQTPSEEIRRRCQQVVSETRGEIDAEVTPVESMIGGGAAPKSRVASYAIAFMHARISAPDLLAALRHLERPIIGRIEEDRVLLDLRTVEPEFDTFVAESLRQIAGGEPSVR